MNAKIHTPFPDIPAEGDAITVAPGVLWMRLPLPMALDHVNVYALDDGDGWTVIDTGFSTKRSKAIWDVLLAGPLEGRPINRLIVTHHHPDHVGLAGWFMEKGAILSMPRTGYLQARMLTLDVQDVPNPETMAFYRTAGMDAEIYAKRAVERPFNFADCVDPIPLGYHRLQEGHPIQFGQRTWDIRMGDGHAPEHATFWSRDDNLVIGGDQLLLSISPNLGVYPTEPDADPVHDWITSCEAFQSIAKPEQLILAGHKLPYVGLPKRLEQMIGNHHEALDRLHGYLDTPKTAGECFQPLFKRKIDGGTYGLALVESVAHLNHLYQTGKASRTMNADGAWVYQRI